MVKKKKFHKELRKIKLEIPKNKSEEKKEIKAEDKKLEQKEEKKEEKRQEEKETKNEEQKMSDFSEKILEENIGFVAPIIPAESEGESFSDSLEDVAGSIPSPVSLTSNTGNLYEIRSSYGGNSTSGTYDNSSKYDMNQPRDISLDSDMGGFDPFREKNSSSFSSFSRGGRDNSWDSNSERRQEQYTNVNNLEKINPVGRKKKRESF